LVNLLTDAAGDFLTGNAVCYCLAHGVSRRMVGKRWRDIIGTSLRITWSRAGNEFVISDCLISASSEVESSIVGVRPRLRCSPYRGHEMLNDATGFDQLDTQRR
jgi:hypothetical protein